VTNPGPRSGLIVEITAAEPVVRQHRERLDASAQLGVPAHITVLFPFMPPEEISEGTLISLERLFASVSGFDFQLDRTAWFGDTVLWLAPRDPGPFRTLTRQAFEAFPDFPPYQGQFDDVVPHLTVGHGSRLNDLRIAEESVRTRLPIQSHAAAVTLITQDVAAGRWTRAATFALADTRGWGDGPRTA
jgi:2'-5' RNA ligase